MDKVRAAAVEVVYDVFENGAYANVALVQKLRKGDYSDIDRRFMTELVYGTVKAMGTLDWILRQYVSRPVSKIQPYIRAILRVGIYQLRYLEKVPAAAVCNESVEIAKKYGNAGTVKFVNAVLRNVVRNPEKAVLPDGKGKATQHLALSSLHPEWIVRQWIKRFGYDAAERLCEFDNAPAVLSIRTNTLKTTRDELLQALQNDGWETEPSTFAPEGILCRGGHGSLDSSKLLAEGHFQVQDESSMQVAHVLEPQPGEFIIDACSAPGGKTTHIAQLMQNKGRIAAFDLYDAKLKRIQENAERLGITCIETIEDDARHIGERFKGQADRMLVDAPCSGMGVLRRRADARWRKTEKGNAELPALQLEILDGAVPALKTGGILVYSTCTIEPAENQEVVTEFLKRHSEFVLEKTGLFLPTKKRPDEDMVQFYPHEDGIDGFFIARMRKVK
ncbi:MAG: 16S rRNA (cytosine(967)-C(5))-methyltransferase RsmB [Schwartzia sp.]|nr:16S rRNA (cytosine(967)-C(5))-methyltransferase RsmB [Schwartzia sp. (in: firmicutes)]